MSVKFYNPGSRIYELMKFDHPTNDPKVQNLVSYYQIDAAEASFFEVPTEITVITDSGEERNISVNFAKRLKEDYREFGVVMIDPKRDPKKKPIADEDNVALNEKDAKIKGDLLLKDAMFRLIREHETIVIEARNNGHRPQRAKGNVAHALKTLGIEDPANDVEDVVKRKQDTSEVAELKRQVEELKSLMLGAKGK